MSEIKIAIKYLKQWIEIEKQIDPACLGSAYAKNKKGKIKAIEVAIQALTEKQGREQGWIPVSERLPEKYGTYIVAWRPGYIDGDQIKKNTDSDLTHYYEIISYSTEEGWLDDLEQCDEYTVLAWRELPEPYKEVQNG